MPRIPASVELAALLIALAGLGVVGYSLGGFGEGALLVGIASAVPLYLAARAWRLPWWLHLIAAALPALILVLAAVEGEPAGSAGATRVGYAALLLLGVAAWARTAGRRSLAAVLFAALVIVEYGLSWPAWWQLGDPLAPLAGRFFQPDAFAAWSAAGVAVALLLLLGRHFTVIAVLAAAIGSATVLQAAAPREAVLLGAVYLLALVLALVARGWRGIVRWGVAVLAGYGVAVLLVSPVLFPATGISDPFRAVAAGWPEEVWLSWPGARALVLVPVVAALAGAAVLLVLSARSLGRPSLVADPGRWAGLLALVPLLGHAATGGSWITPALVAAVGFAGALGLAPLVAGRVADPEPVVVPAASFAPTPDPDAPPPPAPPPAPFPWSGVASGVLAAAIVALALVGYLTDPVAFVR